MQDREGEGGYCVPGDDCWGGEVCWVEGGPKWGNLSVVPSVSR